MEELCSKTKKHKRKLNHETEREAVELDDFKQLKKKKDKKKKKKYRQADSENKTFADEEVMKCSIENEVSMVNNHAVKKRKLSDPECAVEEEHSKKKKTKRKDYDLQEEHQRDTSKALSTENAGDSEDFSGNYHKKAKRKKSKKKKTIENEEMIDHEQIKNSVKATEEMDPDSNRKTEECTLNVKEKKKHKKKQTIAEIVEESNETMDNLDEANETDNSSVKKKKKKDKKKERNNDTVQEEIIIQKLMHVKNQEKQDVINLKKKTNNEKMNLNVKSANTVKPVALKTGQWSSVELGDSERQNKFYRLLGGFKKGSDTSQLQNKFGLGKKTVFHSSSNVSKNIGGNFAMNKKQEDLYTKSLEGEYDRAMTMNLNRGIGLGFEKPPDEGKKFYIDTKSSKSIKFDD